MTSFVTEIKPRLIAQGKAKTLLGHLDDVNTKPDFPLTHFLAKLV